MRHRKQDVADVVRDHLRRPSRIARNRRFRLPLSRGDTRLLSIHRRKVGVGRIMMRPLKFSAKQRAQASISATRPSYRHMIAGHQKRRRAWSIADTGDRYRHKPRPIAWMTRFSESDAVCCLPRLTASRCSGEITVPSVVQDLCRTMACAGDVQRTGRRCLPDDRAPGP